MKLRALAACAALLVVTACGSDGDGGSDPDPSPTTESTEDTEETGLSDDDLEDALLTVDDVPSALGEDFEEVDVTEGGLESGDIVDGAEECEEFIDDDYGAEDIAKAEAELESADGEATVYSTVKAYEEGEDDAERELESLRDVLSRCESMIVDLDGTEAVVEIQFTDLTELDGYEDFGDEGMAVAMQVTIDDELVLRDGYTLIRVDDVITFSGASTAADLGDEVMLPLTESATELLEDLLADAS